MKFIVFGEYKPENLEKVRAKGEEVHKDLKQNPDKYPRYMLLQDGTGAGFGMIGKYKSVSLVEADNEEQLQNAVEGYAPLVKFTWVPIRQSANAKQG
jgi:muconolactone delta-isomerase